MPVSTLKPGLKCQSPALAPPRSLDPVPFRVLAEVERPVIPVNLRRLHVEKPDEDDIYDEMDRESDDQVSAELEALGVHV